MMHSTQKSTYAAPAASRNYGPALAVMTTTFFMWGFVTSLNDILIPHLKAIFELNYFESMLVQFVFFLAYFIMAQPSAKVISWLGYQKSLVTGLLVMAVGALMFMPAASLTSYGLFLAAFYILASGMTILQVAANPYVAMLGDPKKSSSRLNLAQAFNSLGTTIGPKLGGLLILSASYLTVEKMRSLSPEQLQAYRMTVASSVKMPYIVIAAMLLLLAILIAFFKLPLLSDIEDSRGHESTGWHDSIWRHKHLVLGALAIFVYVGAEVSIGSFLVNYFKEPNIAGLQEQAASGYVWYYWGGAMVGRFVGSALMQKIKPGLVLGTAAMVACLLVVTTILTNGHTAMWAILAVGLFNSVMFPTIFTLGIDGLGKLTGKGSGLLIMAIVGGALIPLAQGRLADAIGIHTAFIIPAICYLYIVYYGLSGSKHPPIVEHA